MALAAVLTPLSASINSDCLSRSSPSTQHPHAPACLHLHPLLTHFCTPDHLHLHPHPHLSTCSRPCSHCARICIHVLTCISTCPHTFACTRAHAHPHLHARTCMHPPAPMSTHTPARKLYTHPHPLVPTPPLHMITIQCSRFHIYSTGPQGLY